MAQQATGYLPGDPRFGLDEDQLADYYRAKPAQWVIFCWYRPDSAAVFEANLTAQKAYARQLGERLIGYGHIVSDDRSEVLATTWFVQQDGRAAAEAFVHADPMCKACAYDRVEYKRWSNSFLKGQKDYARKGQQLFFFTGSKLPDARPFYLKHLEAHEAYFARHEDCFVFRGPLRSPDGSENVGTAILVEMPDRTAARAFWDNEPFSANGGYQDDWRMYRWVFGDEM